MEQKFSLILKKRPQKGLFTRKNSDTFDLFLATAIDEKFWDSAVIKEEINDKLEAGLPVVLLSGVEESIVRHHAKVAEDLGAVVEVHED